MWSLIQEIVGFPFPVKQESELESFCREGFRQDRILSLRHHQLTNCLVLKKVDNFLMLTLTQIYI